jgi:hypothetical protein
LRRRGRTGHLDEPGTLLELVQVIGAVKTLGAGAKFVFEANELVTAARGVGTSIELLTKLEGGLQIISIPFVVRDQLRAIDAMGPETSGTHKAARMAFILGRAIRDAQVAVHSIHPGEEASFYDDSKEIEHEGKPKEIEHEGKAPPAGGRQEHEGPPPSPGEPGAKREHPDAPGKKPTAEGEPSKPSSHEEPGATRTDEQLRSQVRAEVRDDTIVAETSVVNAHNEPHEYHRSRDGRIRRCSWACMLMIDNVRERIRAMDAALPESTPLVKDWREIIRRADDLQRRSTAASAEQTTRENRLAGLKEGSPKWTISKNALANWMKERNRVFNDTAAEIEQALSRIERRAGIEAKPDVRVNAPIESSAQLLEDFADVANDERYKAELEAIRRLESDSGQRNEALNRLALLRQAMVRHVEENIPAQVEAARAARQRVGQGTTGPNKGVLAGSGDGRTRVESGWWDAEDPGITQATEQVVAIAQQGYAFPAHNFDPPDRPGLYYASHAEKQMNALRPGEPIGVSEDMCFDCYNYFRWRAQAMGRPLVVADPTVTRVFYPDGRVSAPPRAGASATQTANAPR